MRLRQSDAAACAPAQKDERSRPRRPCVALRPEHESSLRRERVRSLRVTVGDADTTEAEEEISPTVPLNHLEDVKKMK